MGSRRLGTLVITSYDMECIRSRTLFITISEQEGSHSNSQVGNEDAATCVALIAVYWRNAVVPKFEGMNFAAIVYREDGPEDSLSHLHEGELMCRTGCAARSTTYRLAPPPWVRTSQRHSVTALYSPAERS